MFRRTLPAVAVTMMLALPSSVFAQTIRQSMASAVATTVQQDQPRERQHNKMRWTGFGLLMGGASFVLLGAINNSQCEDFTYGRYRYNDVDCHDLTTGFYIIGGALAGTGLALAGVAMAKDKNVPSVDFGPGHIGVHKSFVF